MRSAVTFTFILAALLGFSAVPALAGTVGIIDGKVTWQSTECTAPVAPASILAANKESSGEDVNALVTLYNQYASASDAYLSCLSKEAETDANATAVAVANAAKEKIDATHQGVVDLGKPLQGKAE